MSSLYALSDEMKNFVNSLDNLEEGQEPDVAAFESLQGSFNEKIVGVIKYMRSFGSLASAAKAEAKALAALAKQYENQEKKRKNYADLCLKKAGITALDTAIAKIKYEASDAVVILDEAKIPAKYKEETITISISKKLIGDDLKAGIDVPGAGTDPTPLIKITTPKGKKNADEQSE